MTHALCVGATDLVDPEFPACELHPAGASNLFEGTGYVVTDARQCLVRAPKRDDVRLSAGALQLLEGDRTGLLLGQREGHR